MAAPHQPTLLPALPPDDLKTRELNILDLLVEKKERNLTFDDIAEQLGYTNVFAAQIFLMRESLPSNKVATMRSMLPTIFPAIMDSMQFRPSRAYNPAALQNPVGYRLMEVIKNFGEAIQIVISEKFGDGVMSSIDQFVSVGKELGADGHPRVVVTFSGKFLPFKEQNVSELKLHKPV